MDIQLKIYAFIVSIVKLSIPLTISLIHAYVIYIDVLFVIDNSIQAHWSFTKVSNYHACKQFLINVIAMDWWDWTIQPVSTKSHFANDIDS